MCSRSRQTVALNLLRARTLPGSWSFVLSGKNSDGKTPYYSQTVAFRGCFCHDQHDITLGIARTYNRPPENVPVFQENSSFFFFKHLFESHFRLIVFSDCPAQHSLLNANMSSQSTISSYCESLFLKSNCTQSDHKLRMSCM